MAKLKLKTNRAAAKRFKVTGTGKLKRSKAYKRHILTKKSTKTKRNLRKAGLVDCTNEKQMKRILPYLQDKLRQEVNDMARVKGGMSTKKRRNRVLKLAKGYRGAKSKQFRTAKQAVMKSLNYAYVGRKLRKREFRTLWIARINAAARLNGLSYSRFMNGLKNANVNINRKMLSELAISNPAAFTQLVETAKANLKQLKQ